MVRALKPVVGSLVRLVVQVVVPQANSGITQPLQEHLDRASAVV
jgi:hypothetical protein